MEPGRGHRVAVVGDVGGHLDELRRELVRLGADEATGALPADLTVIQVGDLVHRGPDSAGVIALVDRYLDAQPEQWIQLVGNHEALYLGEPAFDWPERLDERSAQTVRRWWGEGRLLAAAAVQVSEQQEFLVTHAGVTQMYWRTVLEAPRGADVAAHRLNQMIGRRTGLLFRPGQLLGSGRPRPSAGPLWATAATELLPGWLNWHLPFSQVHGHTSLYSWELQRFRAGRVIRHRTLLNRRSRHEISVLPGGRIIGVDPGHGRLPAGEWHAWEVTVSHPPNVAADR